MSHTFKFRIAGLAGLAVVAVLPAAHAAEAPEMARAVAAGDLDLNRPADVARLRHRLAVAAADVCLQADPGARLGQEGYDACMRDALRTAEPRVQAMIAEARQGEAVAANGHF